MKISYNWLNELVPELPNPKKLSHILTSIGLEVEDVQQFEEIRGGFAGLIVGVILACEKHPEADKLNLTKIDAGSGRMLNIVCGAPNVAVGQKVVVAPVGSMIYPLNSEPLTIKKAKIRGIESNGMICAEDEIGLGTNHEGIITLPESVETGSYAADYFKPVSDWIFEIGLTPNRIDAMSHIGVARDLCAFLSHHYRKTVSPKPPFQNNFKVDNNTIPVTVIIENTEACERYTGLSITNVKVETSPTWLQQRKEGNKMPQLSDLRESGAIEQDADMVMFLYRPEYYDITTNELGESNKGETHVRIAKHRNGQLETIKLKALLHIQKFVEEDGEFTPSLPAGGNWTPVKDIDSDGAKLYIQKGSKMNDGEFDDETPF
jgi:tRNA-binding EMAP/Myf-like protein